MKPVCIPCERFMRPKRNGYAFIEGMHDGSIQSADMTVGKNAPGWRPYKLWLCDLYECPTCGAQAIQGCGSRPVAEHFEPTFAREVTSYGATLLVKDC